MALLVLTFMAALDARAERVGDWSTGSVVSQGHAGYVIDVSDPSPNDRHVREQAAQSLYADAKAYATLAEWEAAQRLLEVVIKRYPKTAAAHSARKDMADIVKRFSLTGSRYGLGVRAPQGIVPRQKPPLAEPLGQGADARAPGDRPELDRGALRAPEKRPDDASSKSMRPNTTDSDRTDMGRWSTTVAKSAPGPQERLRTIAGDRLFFGSHSAQVGQRGTAVIVAQARWLKANADLAVTVHGHADEPGADAAANRRISKQRADAVKALLITHGVAAHRIKIAANGRSVRVAVCDAPLCQAQNRRVEVRVAPFAKSAASRSARR